MSYRWRCVITILAVLALALSPRLQEVQEEDYVLIPVRSVEGDGVYSNDLSLIIDGKFAEDMGAWDGERCVYWEDPEAYFIVDLGGVYQVVDVLLQVDDDDVYTVEHSMDGLNYLPFYSFYEGYGQTGVGMDTMSSNPGDPNHVLVPDTSSVQARFLRLTASSGDVQYALAEFQAFGYPLEPAEEPESWLIAPVSALGTGEFSGPAELLFDDQIPDEESVWDGDEVVSWSDPDCQFVIDLGRAYRITHILAQINSGNGYRIDYSLDDLEYISLVALTGASLDVSSGMDTVCTDPGNPEYVPDLDFFPVEARYIKIYGVEGEGPFAVSELQVFGQELIRP
jgi:hypothetical protein